MKTCLQGCGKKVRGRAFCSKLCRALYNAHTWGEGCSKKTINKITSLPADITKGDSILIKEMLGGK